MEMLLFQMFTWSLCRLHPMSGRQNKTRQTNECKCKNVKVDFLEVCHVNLNLNLNLLSCDPPPDWLPEARKVPMLGGSDRNSPGRSHFTSNALWEAEAEAEAAAVAEVLRLRLWLLVCPHTAASPWKSESANMTPLRRCASSARCTSRPPSNEIEFEFEFDKTHTPKHRK